MNPNATKSIPSNSKNVVATATTSNSDLKPTNTTAVTAATACNNAHVSSSTVTATASTAIKTIPTISVPSPNTRLASTNAPLKHPANVFPQVKKGSAHTVSPVNVSSLNATVASKKKNCNNHNNVLSAGAAAAKLSTNSSGGGATASVTSSSSVQNGENTGRWTADEHRLFLQGLEQHGKGWKKIASLIKSRTVVQIRTHAQKYFQKLAKARQNGEEGDVAMEGRHGHNGVPNMNQKKRQRQMSGTKRKGIANVVASAAKEGEETWPPKVAPALAPFVNRTNMVDGSNGFNATSTYEDSLYRFLTPAVEIDPDMSGISITNTSATNEGNKSNNKNSRPSASIILPNDLPGLAPSSMLDEGNSPTCISAIDTASCNYYFPFVDKAAPGWFTKGADVEDLLQDAAALDWLADASTTSSNTCPICSIGPAGASNLTSDTCCTCSSNAIVTDAESNSMAASSSSQSISFQQFQSGASNAPSRVESQGSLSALISSTSANEDMNEADISIPNLFEHGSSVSDNTSNKRLKSSNMSMPRITSQHSLGNVMSSSNMMIIGPGVMSMEDLNYGTAGSSSVGVESFNVFGDTDVSFDEHAFVSALLDQNSSANNSGSN
jgi:SHAQKYF class myb-like DNA-binding protein